MTDDLARCFDFVLRHDMCGSRVEPFAFGTAVFLPELPLRHDSNYLLVDASDAEIDVDALVAAADAVQGGAGLDHRCLMFRDADAGERLAPAFEERGWESFRGVVMALRRPSERSADTSRVVETTAERLRPARAADILRYPWCTPEVARQLLDARAFAPVEATYLAVFEGDEPAAWVELYAEDGVAQVEALATVERFRGRGHATALMTRAAELARGRGAALVFLCADATDWPRELYTRLGYDEIGRYVKLTRTPAA